jgi:hypothetical protein
MCSSAAGDAIKKWWDRTNETQNVRAERIGQDPGGIGGIVQRGVDPFMDPIIDVSRNIEDADIDVERQEQEKAGTVKPVPGTSPEFALPDEEDEELSPELLGRLAGQRRIERGGRGIGANILTSGSGIPEKAKTKRKTLLG